MTTRTRSFINPRRSVARSRRSSLMHSLASAFFLTTARLRVSSALSTKKAANPRLEVKITHAANGTAKLRAEKGINLPDTKLNISALTPKDREDLEFATEHGDLVSLSFVRRPEDVAELIRELDRLGATETGIILKDREPPCSRSSSANSAHGNGTTR